ncbi:hypothetical protein SRHO_G00226240 [Serrasalmus rhombeus]
MWGGQAGQRVNTSMQLAFSGFSHRQCVSLYWIWDKTLPEAFEGLSQLANGQITEMLTSAGRNRINKTFRERLSI